MIMLKMVVLAFSNEDREHRLFPRCMAPADAADAVSAEVPHRGERRHDDSWSAKANAHFMIAAACFVGSLGQLSVSVSSSLSPDDRADCSPRNLPVRSGAIQLA